MYRRSTVILRANLSSTHQNEPPQKHSHAIDSLTTTIMCGDQVDRPEFRSVIQLPLASESDLDKNNIKLFLSDSYVALKQI